MHFTPIHFAEIQSNAELFEIYNATGEFLLYISFFDEQEGEVLWVRHILTPGRENIAKRNKNQRFDQGSVLSSNVQGRIYPE